MKKSFYEIKVYDGMELLFECEEAKTIVCLWRCCAG